MRTGTQTAAPANTSQSELVQQLRLPRLAVRGRRGRDLPQGARPQRDHRGVRPENPVHEVRRLVRIQPTLFSWGGVW